jgi:anti-sigma B factor antagonist
VSASISQATFAVARSGTTVYVRASGLANMKNAPTLHGFLEAELSQGMRQACIDLGGCLGMDSTFMGMMVEYAKRLEDQNGRLVIVNPGERNLALLAMLGVDEVIRVIEQCSEPAADFTDITCEPSMSTRQRMQLIRSAHENLVRLSESNQSKFAAFLQALNKDLSVFDAKAAKPATEAKTADSKEPNDGTPTL